MHKDEKDLSSMATIAMVYAAAAATAAKTKCVNVNQNGIANESIGNKKKKKEDD